MDPSNKSMVKAAARIHASLPVVDGHNDLPWEIRVRASGSLATADPRSRLDGYHTDLPRMIEGGVGVQFWSVFVPTWVAGPLAATHRQIDLVEEMSALAPDLTALADTASQARRIRNDGRIAGFMGAEGGHSIENDLSAIDGLYERGVRYMTLTHADTIDWADSATDEVRHRGLTEFGHEVVRKMNRVGMLVDISHVSADTMRQAITTSRAPVIASHSSARALAPHPRNVPDDVIEMVAAGGGVVMVTFVPAFLILDTALAALDMFQEMRQLREHFDPDDEAAYSAASRKVQQQLDEEVGSVTDVVDHIEYIARVGGVDHVGLGSDFDGVENLPEGLEDVTTYPAITTELLHRGWTEPDIRKILGENALRALEAAEQLAG
jgi:membrane dipeptidase